MTIEIYIPSTTGGWQKRSLSELDILPGDLYFGAKFSPAESDAEDSTTESTYQEKLSLTSETLKIGNTYVVFWYCEVKANLQNKIVGVRVQIDDTINELEVEHEGNEWVPISGFALYAVTGAGTHQIDIDYKAIDGTGYIRKARLLGWLTSEA